MIMFPLCERRKVVVDTNITSLYHSMSAPGMFIGV